jgi:hypothetical protein
MGNEVVALRRPGSGRTAVRGVRRASLWNFVCSTSNAARSESILSGVKPEHPVSAMLDQRDDPVGVLGDVT